MDCIHCGKATRVSNKRQTGNGTKIWRRRICEKCERTFSTYEKAALDYLIIEKRSGNRVRYAPEKLFASIYEAIVSGKHKDRGDAASGARSIQDDVEMQLMRKDTKRISTTDLVDLIIGELEKHDRAAAYRYAAFSPHRGMKFGI